MEKLARFGAAALLGLMMAMTLLVPGAFAQSVNTHQSNAPHVAVISQQAVQPASANWRWHRWHRGWGGWGGWGWGGWGWGGGCGWGGCGGCW